MEEMLKGNIEPIYIIEELVKAQANVTLYLAKDWQVSGKLVDEQYDNIILEQVYNKGVDKKIGETVKATRRLVFNSDKIVYILIRD